MLVDTNVLIDVLGNDPEWADWSVAQMRMQAKVHVLSINPIIYAELSSAFNTIDALDEAVDALELRMLELSRPALFLAGKAFTRYRRHGGARERVLSDFLIGAHAAVSRLPVLTRDARRYRTYFPTVEVVSPI